MDEKPTRVIRAGLPQSGDPRKAALLLVVVMLLSIMQPVSADVTVARDDFGVLDALAETLESRSDANEELVAINGAQESFAILDASKRPVQAGDALSDAENYLSQVELRDTSPLIEDHPRPYNFLTDLATSPDDWPYNLWETLFSVDNLGIDNLL